MDGQTLSQQLCLSTVQGISYGPRRSSDALARSNRPRGLLLRVVTDGTHKSKSNTLLNVGHW